MKAPETDYSGIDDGVWSYSRHSGLRPEPVFSVSAIRRVSRLKEEVDMVTTPEEREAKWAKWPQGDAGDAIDFACGHCSRDKAIAFLNDWRSDRADEWPEYMKWLRVQRDGARAAIAAGTRSAET